MPLYTSPAVASAGPLANPNTPGLGFETYPRHLAVNNGSITSQRLFLVPIWLPAGLTITSITFGSGTTALSVGTHQLFGLYDNDAGTIAGSARALLRGSTDDTSTAWGSNTNKTLGLTSTYLTPTAGRYYLGILVAATTPPSLIATNSLGSGPRDTTPNMGGSTSNTSINALPNPAAAVNNNSSTPPWAYVS